MNREKYCKNLELGSTDYKYGEAEFTGSVSCVAKQVC